MATKFTAGTVINAGAVIVGVDADAPPATPSAPAPEPAPVSEPQILPLSRAVSLLMDASATADGSVVDSSTNSHPITTHGDVSQSSFSPYRSGGYSLYNTGTNHIEKTGLTAPGTGDFTVEAWVYVTNSSANQMIWDTRPISVDNTTGMNAQFRSNNVLYAGSANVGYITGTTTFNDNEWVHVALVRSGGTLTLYGNGVSQGSISHSVNLTSTDINIGSNRSGASVFNGYIRDLRVVNDAVYTGDFTPSTSPLTSISNTALLTCNLPYVSSDLTITGDVYTKPFSPYDYVGYSESLHGGSYVFDGSGDYLSVDLGDNLIDSNTPFTVEFWMYPENISNRGILHFTNNPGTLETTLYISGAGNLSWFDSRVGSAAAGDITPNSGGGITTNEWHHIALTRQSDNYVKIYVDGQLYNTSSNVWDLGLSRYLEVGRYANTAYFDGYVSDLRIIEGTAVYTEDFTPSTAPLEAVTGTSLLLSGNNAAIRDESQSVESISVFGNTTVADSSPYGTGKSISLDGNGDYLSMPKFDLGSDPFTVEFWMNVSNENAVVVGSHLQNQSNGWYISYNASVIYWSNFNNGNGNDDQWGVSHGMSTMTGQWHHIAVAKDSSNTMRMFLNGIMIGSKTDNGNYVNSPSEIFVGAVPNVTSGLPVGELNGLISDLRIVKGTAVYTENFSVPTAPLGDYSESTPAPAPEPAPEPAPAPSANWVVVGAIGDDDKGSDSGSVYVYDANDLSAQPTKLTAYDGYDIDNFGHSVAVNSDKIVVAAPKDDDNGSSSGSVYVYDANDLSAQPTKLVPFNVTAGARLGYSVAATANKIVAGAYLEDTQRGSVYVYDANDLSVQPTKLIAFDGAAYDRFGASVAATSDKIVVGSFRDDDNGSNSGSVYVYDANDLTTLPTKLTAFDGTNDDFFGASVAATSDKIVVGATLDDDNGENSGSVYVYDANDLTAQPTKLTAFDGAQDDTFGNSVAATSDKIVVGSNYDDDDGSKSGSVYVYDANDLSAQPTKLTAYDGATEDRFGHSVAVMGDKIVVGAQFNDDDGENSGSVYVYDANDLTAQPTKLTAFDGDVHDYFGYSVAVG